MRKFLLIAVVGILLLSGCLQRPSYQQPPEDHGSETVAYPKYPQIIEVGEVPSNENLKTCAGSVTIELDNYTGSPRKISGGMSVICNMSWYRERRFWVGKEDADMIINKFMRENEDFLMIDMDQLMLVRRIEYDGGGYFYRYLQYHNNLSVYNAEISITMSRDGMINDYTGTFYPHINIPTEPKISSEEAIEIAKDGLEQYFIEAFKEIDEYPSESADDIINGYVRGNSSKISGVEYDTNLLVYPKLGNDTVEYHLAWRVKFRRRWNVKFFVAEPPCPKVFVDAINSEVISIEFKPCWE